MHLEQLIPKHWAAAEFPDILNVKQTTNFLINSAWKLSFKVSRANNKPPTTLDYLLNDPRTNIHTNKRHTNKYYARNAPYFPRNTAEPHPPFLLKASLIFHQYVCKDKAEDLPKIINESQPILNLTQILKFPQRLTLKEYGK